MKGLQEALSNLPDHELGFTWIIGRDLQTHRITTVADEISVVLVVYGILLIAQADEFTRAKLCTAQAKWPNSAAHISAEGSQDISSLPRSVSSSRRGESSIGRDERTNECARSCGQVFAGHLAGRALQARQGGWSIRVLLQRPRSATRLGGTQGYGDDERVLYVHGQGQHCVRRGAAACSGARADQRGARHVDLGDKAPGMCDS